MFCFSRLKFSFISSMLCMPSIVLATAPTSGVAGNAAGAPSPFASFIPFALIFLIFYFLLIRPQKKKAQEEENFIKSLGKGAEVFTKSGIIGTIVGLTDKVVTLEIAQGVKIKVLRHQIAGLADKLQAQAS